MAATRIGQQDRQHQRVRREVERLRALLEGLQPADYPSESIYKRVRTRREGKLKRLEKMLQLSGSPLTVDESQPSTRSGHCLRCGRTGEQIYNLIGCPAALCYDCWADLGNQWCTQHQFVKCGYDQPNGPPLPSLSVAGSKLESQLLNELAARQSLERTTAIISSRFNGLMDLDAGIQASLADLGRYTAASRSYLFLLRQNGTAMDNTHEWCAPGVSPQKASLQGLPIDTFPWWMEQLRKRLVIRIDDLDDLPPEAAAEKAVLEMQGIKSLLVLPVETSGELAGFIGLDNVVETGGWTRDNMLLLRVCAEIIGNSLALKRASEEAAKARDLYLPMLEHASPMIWRAGGGTRCDYFNRSWLRFTGRELADELNDGWITGVHPEDLAICLRQYHEACGNQRPFALQYRLRHRDGKYRWVADFGVPFADAQGQVAGYLGACYELRPCEPPAGYDGGPSDTSFFAAEGFAAALQDAIEMHDPLTASHQRRVAKLATAIARELDLPESQTANIGLAAALHDVGKAAVPAAILRQPHRLTGGEFDTIKRHSTVGRDMLAPMRFPDPVAETVGQHHERIDGSGYPAGLAGERILFDAKVIGVADVVEAMSSTRPYRPALGVDHALQEIQEYAGVLYDPYVVEACVSTFTRRGFTFE